MVGSLIAFLNANLTRSPDQIVEHLSDPFPTWRQTNTLTLEEFEKYRETRIVICNQVYRERTSTDAEDYHKLGTEERGRYHRWQWASYETGTLSESIWWFRSHKSWEANPNEGF